MGFFSRLRATNRQAKVAANVSVYLELAGAKHIGFSADDLATEITVRAIHHMPNFFNPSDPIAPQVLPLTALVLASAADTESIVGCACQSAAESAIRDAIGRLKFLTPIDLSMLQIACDGAGLDFGAELDK